MIARIRQKFTTYFFPTQIQPSISPIEIHPSASSENTWVFIWNMTKNGPGHAAIQVGGNEPKLTENQSGEYISLHPRNIPAIGPTTLLPLPAKCASNLSEDMQLEYYSQFPDRIHSFDDLPNNTLNCEDVKFLPPYQTYKINGLDTNSIRACIDAKKQDVGYGKHAYQLLPNVNLMNLFRDSSAFSNHDPIDIELHNRFLPKKENQMAKDNCTTFISDMLNIGGLPIKKSNMPWGLTPNGLANQIDPSFLWSDPNKEEIKLKGPK